MEAGECCPLCAWLANESPLSVATATHVGTGFAVGVCAAHFRRLLADFCATMWANGQFTDQTGTADLGTVGASARNNLGRDAGGTTARARCDDRTGDVAQAAGQAAGAGLALGVGVFAVQFAKVARRLQKALGGGAPDDLVSGLAAGGEVSTGNVGLVFVAVATRGCSVKLAGLCQMA